MVLLHKAQNRKENQQWRFTPVLPLLSRKLFCERGYHSDQFGHSDEHCHFFFCSVLHACSKKVISNIKLSIVITEKLSVVHLVGKNCYLISVLGPSQLLIEVKEIESGSNTRGIHFWLKWYYIHILCHLRSYCSQ
jgi:hypothetical protein